MVSVRRPLDMTSPFVPGPVLRIAGAAGGPLAGLTFAAKDLFDVAGHPTGGGNPDWGRAHPIPTRHAWAVQRLLDAGARLVGKTVTDEVSLGILGENPFDGTPLNPSAPDRVPGGSSSGSASAVAQGLCDTAPALQPMVGRLSELVKDVREEMLAPPGLSVWARAQRMLQSFEAWTTFKDWIDRENPRMAWSVARNLALAATISEPERQWAALTRAEARARLAWLLPPGTILCLPTTPFPAPRKGLPLATLDPLRARITCLAAHGGLTGVPQVSLPGAQVNGLPVGLSILAARGADATLVAVAKAMEAGA